VKVRVFFSALALFGTLAAAQTTPVYNSIPIPLPGNITSVGPEAVAFSELGEGMYLNANSGTFGQVAIMLSSWACQKGGVYSGNCVSTPGATFKVPITVKLYSVTSQYSSIYTTDVPTPNASIGSITQTFNIPYRPSSTPAQCSGDTTQWYGPMDKACYHGLATPIVVDFSSLHIPVPANGQVIVTVAFNTTHYGPAPIGEKAPCYTASGGCPYDSLNIGADTSSFVMNTATPRIAQIGSPLDANGIFVNYTYSANACPGNTVTGTLALDKSTDNSPCWAGYHPEVLILANTNKWLAPRNNHQ
jgi:hypothetical protein